MKISCPHCGKPTSNKALKCVHCSRTVKQAKARAEDQRVNCPRCNVKTDVMTLWGIELDLCSRCCGLWFDKGELQQFEDAVTDQDINSDVLRILNELNAMKSCVNTQKVYLNCPVCSSPMARVNYAEVSGIIIDRCPDHGSWLDHQDAIKLLEIMAEGGKEVFLKKAQALKNKELLTRIRNIEYKQTAQSVELQRVRRFAWTHFVLDFFGFT